MPHGSVAMEAPSFATASLSSWKQRYLTAVYRYVTLKRPSDRESAITIAKILRRVRLTGGTAPCDREDEVAKTFRNSLYGMALQNPGAWCNFFVTDIGLENAAEMGRFKAVSPFAGCVFLLIRSGNELLIRGEVKEFRQLLRRDRLLSLQVVHCMPFMPKCARKNHYQLHVLRPAPVAEA